MLVRVLLFASYADAFGSEHIDLPVRDGATVADIVSAMRELPGGHVLPRKPLVAVERNYAVPDLIVAAGDEIALIPPVAGG
jgi:molybdopterin converting factor small subunit